MGAVEDVLATRLDLLNLSTYVGGIEQATAAWGVFDTKLGEVQARQLSFGIAAGAIGAGMFAFLGKAAIAAGEDVETFERASANLKGSLSPDELAEFTAELEQATGVADDSIGAFLGLLGTFQVTGDGAKQLAEPILNAAEALKAQGTSTEQLAMAVGKAIQTGDPSALRRSGIIIEDVGFQSLSAAGRVDALEKALNAQGGATAARDAMNTLGGSIRAAQTAGGSFIEAVGTPLVGVLTTGAKFTTQLAYGFQQLPTPVQTCVTLIGVGLAGAMVLYSVQTVIAIGLTARLAAEQLKAADAAKKMGDANATAGAKAVVGAGGGTGTGRFGTILAGGKVAAGVGAADLALQFLPDEFGAGAGRGLKNIGNAAAVGAGLGGLLGPQGAALGALLGGGVGAVQNLFPGGDTKKDEATEALKEVAANTAKIAANTDPAKVPVSTTAIPYARQKGVELRNMVA